MLDPVDISVIVPVYNAEKTIREVAERIVSVMTNNSLAYELILVDDGSKDKSWEKILDLKKKYPDRITGIQLSRNFGQHNATLCGIQFSNNKLIITIDDDLQSLPEEIPVLLDLQRETGADVVYGIWVKKKHSLFRNIGSKVLKNVSRYLVNGVKDGSSFRLISRGTADQLRNYNHDFVFIDQILSWHTADFAYAKVSHNTRQKGRSGYSPLKLIRMALNIMITYTDIPLKMVTWMGFMLSIITLFSGAYFIIKKMIIGAPFGFTALIVSVFFTSSVILLSLGILGNYIGKIYRSRNPKPNYSIKIKI